MGKLNKINKIFTGCAQIREEEDGSIESMGQCIDKSIISEEEGGKFKITDFGERMLEKGEKAYKEIKVDDTIIKIER